jgi:hypothetical protein
MNQSIQLATHTMQSQEITFSKMSLLDSIIRDDVESALTLVHRSGIDVTKPSIDFLSPLDLCLLHSSQLTFDAFLQQPLVIDWVLAHVDDPVYTSSNSFLWQLVFEGPRPLAMMQILKSYGVPMCWRFPSGYLRDKNLLHSIGWWALCCIRAASQVYASTLQSPLEIVHQTYSMCTMVLDEFDLCNDSPFVGGTSQALDFFSSHD